MTLHNTSKTQTRPALRHALLAAAALLAALLGQGCQTAAVDRAVQPAGAVLFPPPPAQARVQYLGSISSPKDLPSRRSQFADFILGPEPPSVAPLKPNEALLVESRLYVCDTVLNTVLVMDLATGKTRPFAGDRANGKIRQPNSIVRDEQGNFYIADKLRQAVLVYDAQENFLRALGRPGESDVVDVAVGDKYLYVCNIARHQIEAWDRQSGALVRTIGKRGAAGGEFYMPSHLALDRQGNIYVTDTGNFRIQKFSPEGKLLLTFGGHGDGLGKFAWPKGIDVDGAGRIYVVDSRFYNVQIFNPEGKLLLFFGGPGRDNGCLNLPAGVTVQPWPANCAWLTSRLTAGFDAEFLVTVVSQQGEGFVNFFAVARDPASGAPGGKP